MTDRKHYLGDGAYVDVDADIGGVQVLLTTEDGISTTNRVYLGSEELVALLDYLQGLRIIRWSRGDEK